MKKTLVLLLAITAYAVAQAQQTQGEFSALKDSSFMFDLMHALTALSGFTLLSVTILTFVRYILDNRLKSKLIEKGASENIVSQLLQPMNKESKTQTIKWFIIFAGIGLGLGLVDIFQPLGIHSLAIMAFTLSGSFLGYYFFISRSEKK